MIKKTTFTACSFFAILMVAGILVFSPITAIACGYGNSGGSDYVPQRQGPYAPNQQTARAISADQAMTIVSSHISRLNPDLGIGSVNDVGGFFEVEVINKSNEVVQLVGVDKYSGRLMLLN